VNVKSEARATTTSQPEKQGRKASNDCELELGSSLLQPLVARARLSPLRSRGKVWSREHNKNLGAEAAFRAELLAGHEAALRLKEVVWRPEVPARVAEVLRA